ncbi:MAG: DUF488 family protein [Proteobacteria bacterium]|nr:DUF488 family protein [Pseudomonadota bacterium]
MPIRVVRLGTPRTHGEGLRVGTVRKPPRGVPKAQFASRDFYDVWFPTVAPSQETMDIAHAAQSPADWARFFRSYRKEMARPDAAHAIGLLAAMSQRMDFAVGCYCENPAHCHRSALRDLLAAQGATIISMD